MGGSLDFFEHVSKSIWGAISFKCLNASGFKDFDTVDHKTLPLKLKATDFSVISMAMIRWYLYNRSQTVYVLR